MSGFSSRIAKARQFESQLFDKLSELGFRIAINGTEHTHPEFVEALKNSNDQTSLAIRFQPDGVARVGAIPRSFYVEAKDARAIERTAYEQYMKLHKAGNILIVVFKPFKWAWCFIEEMPLIDGRESVEAFPAKMRFPVDSDGWLCPKRTTHGTGRGSNTPYRYIDSSKLRSWAKMKKDLLMKLSAQ